MSIIFLIIMALAIKGAKAESAGGSEYISRESTDQVRGLFTILIFLSHYTQYITAGGYDTLYFNIKWYLGQTIVIPYLFYSGYGMMKALSKNKDYVTSVIRYRIPRIFLQTAIVVTLFLILDLCLGEGDLTAKKVFFSYLLWDSLGNSNWYIFGILGECLIFFVVFQAYRMHDSKWNLVAGTILLTVFTGLFVVWIYHRGQPSYFYDTLIIFPVGCWYALFSDKIEELLQKSTIAFLSCALIALLVIRISHANLYIGFRWKIVWHLAFTAAFILFTMKVRFHSPILAFFGKHVFSIYMLQRIPMILLSHFGWVKETPIMSFTISLICTCLMAIIFDKATKGMLRARDDGKQTEN